SGRRRRFMEPRTDARPKQLFVPSGGTGSAPTVPWCGGWSAICRNYFPSTASPDIYGRSCAPPISSSVVSLRCDAAPGRWCALSTWPVWIASSTPSSSALTWNGKTAPSSYLHKQLDVTSEVPSVACDNRTLYCSRRGISGHVRDLEEPDCHLSRAALPVQLCFLFSYSSCRDSARRRRIVRSRIDVVPGPGCICHPATESPQLL